MRVIEDRTLAAHPCILIEYQLVTVRLKPEFAHRHHAVNCRSLRWGEPIELYCVDAIDIEPNDIADTN